MESSHLATVAVVFISASVAKGGVTIFGYLYVKYCGFVAWFYLYKNSRNTHINTETFTKSFFYSCYVLNHTLDGRPMVLYFGNLIQGANYS